MRDVATRPHDDDRDAWRAYWGAQGVPWRTEPEIGAERQEFLAQRRAVQPDIASGAYPLRDIKLTRADIEWLLATHESGGFTGPVDWRDSRQRGREGLDLRGALLQEVKLAGLPLARICGGLTAEQTFIAGRRERHTAVVHLEWADMRGAHLEGAELSRAHLQNADLSAAHLEHADLFAANLEGAVLAGAFLAGTILSHAFLNSAVYLTYVSLWNAQDGGVFLASVRWGNADLASALWSALPMLGEESEARRRRRPDGIAKRRSTRLQEYRRAVRANRQLATVLQDQGLNEDANRFAYRAQVLQRAVLLRSGRLLSYMGSLFLGITSGYGYKPIRSFATYVAAVLAFAAAYFTLGSMHGQPLNWNEAVVVSMTAFHGRGFFGSTFQPHDPQAAVAAVEALFGLLIEISFIATFTQRFFGK